MVETTAAMTAGAMAVVVAWVMVEALAEMMGVAEAMAEATAAMEAMEVTAAAEASVEET